MPDTFRAFIGINFINLDTHIDGIIWAFGLTDITINALIRNH